MLDWLPTQSHKICLILERHRNSLLNWAKRYEEYCHTKYTDRKHSPEAQRLLQEEERNVLLQYDAFFNRFHLEFIPILNFASFATKHYLRNPADLFMPYLFDEDQKAANNDPNHADHRLLAQLQHIAQVFAHALPAKRFCTCPAYLELLRTADTQYLVSHNTTTQLNEAAQVHLTTIHLVLHILNALPALTDTAHNPNWQKNAQLAFLALRPHIRHTGPRYANTSTQHRKNAFFSSFLQTSLLPHVPAINNAMELVHFRMSLLNRHLNHRLPAAT
jgi:hypothetical protein